MTCPLPYDPDRAPYDPVAEAERQCPTTHRAGASDQDYGDDDEPDHLPDGEGGYEYLPHRNIATERQVRDAFDAFHLEGDIEYDIHRDHPLRGTLSAW